MTNATCSDDRLVHGLVLAAGEGRRLRSYVQQVRGEELPKQYVKLFGRRSMLEQTFNRAEKLIPADHIFTVVSSQHLAHAEVRRQLANRPQETLIVQPANKETGPGILLPLMFIHNRCTAAVVAMFPADHFILEEDRFMNYVNLATQAVKHDPSQIVLLGVKPQGLETEYGYIVPREPAGKGGRFGIKLISAFVEKPTPDLALELMISGALWNTMTMVFQLDTLLELVRRVHPVLYLAFCRILESIGTTEQQKTVDDVYDGLEPVNFSKEILEKIADRHAKSVSVLPVQNVFWSDLGSPDRVLQVLRKLDDPTGDIAGFRSRVSSLG